MVQLNDFSGGLNTRLAPQLIAINEAVIYDNVDNTSKALRPIKDSTDENTAIGTYIINFKYNWISSDTYKDYIKFQEKLYYSDGIGRPQKSVDGITWYNLGIDKPTGTPKVTVVNVPVITKIYDPVPTTLDNITDATLDSASNGNLPEGTYNYKFVNIASLNGITSVVFSKSGTVASGDNSISISSITGVDNKVYVYREYNSEYRLVGSTTGTSLDDDTYDISGNDLLVEKTGFELGTEYLFKYEADDNGLRSKQLSNSLTVDASKKTISIKFSADKTSGVVYVYRKIADDYFKVDEPDDFFTTTDKLLPEITYMDGLYSYCYTYYNSSDGTESQPSKYSSNLSFTDDVALINCTASTDPQVDKIRVYRIGGNLTSMQLAVEASNVTGNIADNNGDDLVIDRPVLNSFNNAPAPIGLNYLTEHNAIFFGVKDDKLYYSDIAYVNNWSVFNFIDFNDKLTGLGVVSNGLLVFTKYATYIVTGTSPATLSRYLLSANQGCIKHKSIAFAKNTLLWASTDGICASSGSEISILSRPKLSKIDLQNVKDAVVYDDVYYISNNGSILAFDTRFGNILRTVAKDADNFYVYEDTLYYSLDKKLYSATSLNNLNMHYKGPIFVNSPDNKDMIIYFKVDYVGSLDITMHCNLDGVYSSITKHLSSATRTNKEILEFNNIVCDSIQLEVQGTGELNVITYNTLDKNTISSSTKYYDTDSFKEIVKINNIAIELDKTVNGYESSNLPFSITNVKLFKDVIIAYKGDITFKFYLQGNLVTTKTLSSTVLATEEILIPSQLSRAYYLKFEYSGTGKLYDIEIDPLLRQTNGR